MVRLRAQKNCAAIRFGRVECVVGDGNKADFGWPRHVIFEVVVKNLEAFALLLG